MKRHALATALLLATTAMSAHAEFTVSPSLGYQVFDNETNGANDAAGVKDGLASAIALGYRVNPNVGLELRYGHARADNASSDGHIRQQSGTLDTYYRFNASSTLQPYVLVGGGLANTKDASQSAGPSYQHTIANAAVGAFYSLTQNVALRGELRVVEDLQESLHDGIASLGVTVGFGGASAPRAAAAAVMPATAPVAPEAPVATPAATPFTAAPVTSLAKSPLNSRIQVLFDTDKSTVKPAYRNEIAKVARALKANPDAKVEIQGYTDSRGSAKHNDALSSARAQAVAKVLVSEFGVAERRIDAKGYGAANPVADNKTAAGRAKNRRVMSATK